MRPGQLQGGSRDAPEMLQRGSRKRRVQGAGPGSPRILQRGPGKAQVVPERLPEGYRMPRELQRPKEPQKSAGRPREGTGGSREAPGRHQNAN